MVRAHGLAVINPAFSLPDTSVAAAAVTTGSSTSRSGTAATRCRINRITAQEQKVLPGLYFATLTAELAFRIIDRHTTTSELPADVLDGRPGYEVRVLNGVKVLIGRAAYALVRVVGLTVPVMLGVHAPVAASLINRVEHLGVGTCGASTAVFVPCGWINRTSTAYLPSICLSAVAI